MNIAFDHPMKRIECWVCGCLFALPLGLYCKKKEDNKGIYCPNGDHLGFGPSRVTQLEEQLEETIRERTRFRLSLEAAARENERLFKRLDKKKKK